MFKDDYGYDVCTIGPHETESDTHYEDTIVEVVGDNHPCGANAAFIAASRNAYRRIRAIIDMLERENERMQHIATLARDYTRGKETAVPLIAALREWERKNA